MKFKIKTIFPGLLLAVLLSGLAGGCRTTHEIRSTHALEPVEVKPIHITIDINIRIDRALDDFFGDLDQADETIEREPTTN